ncbi:MAG: hypothetical protein WCC66_07390 [Rhizobiaceae bacterium]
MPLQNRVDPFGTIHANPARGLFMGNRGGKIHDPATKMLLRRRFASKRWIICVCAYRNWHREVMGQGYTELFFLDEVTALSAGHRPCAFCRRADFNRYCTAVAPDAAERVRIDAVDLKLHAQRLRPKPRLEDSRMPGGWPDGTMAALGDMAFAKRGAKALPWNFTGYGDPRPWHEIAKAGAALLTPQTSVMALQNGYRPLWHPSAGA